jgi:hypothetical protein
VALFVVIVCFLYSLLNQLYVLDAIYFAATGRHNPTWFAPAPGGEAPVHASTARAPAP